ncbi:hypothetical protein BDV59DRAFT_198297 [Aspergillus ambiguus]|uniref:uncharacterized protein n=1 Tax=Aspergillus ambiguus TaxID=176160 RepID=UPI003CCE0E72
MKKRPSSVKAAEEGGDLASLLFRASPIDPALRPPSPSAAPSHGLKYPPNSSSESQSASRQSTTTDAAVAPSSVSSQYSGTLPEFAAIDKSTGSPGHNHSNGFPSSLESSLPGLSALASVASAPTSNLRTSSSDAHSSMSNMTYATSSPAATTGGPGNNPVSLLPFPLTE